MKMKYSADVDILLVELSDERISRAEEVAGVIVHLGEDGEPVMLEIQGAKEFVAQAWDAVFPGAGERQG